MPIDRRTIVKPTAVDKLTKILADDNRDFFIDTYSFYLVALIMSGKSLFYGRGRFVNIFFVKSKEYSFPRSPSDDAPEGEVEQYRQQAGEQLDRIKAVLFGKNDKNKSDDFYDIVSTLGCAARVTVASFLVKMQDPQKRRDFIQDRRDENVTIRKTLQIMFWNELKNCFEEKRFAFKKKGNGYYIYIPKNSARTDPDELLKNVNEDGQLVLPEQKSAYYEAFKEEEKQANPHIHDYEQNERVRFLRDSWDIRRYRIFLVKQVGDKLSFRLKHLFPMKCYALYYGLCDRAPFLNMIQNPEERLHYENEKKWSDQMIADLFAQDPSIPEDERLRISRKNVTNYRRSYINELISWLCDNVPGLEKYMACDLVSADDIRFEEIAVPFFRTHLSDMTKEKLLGMSDEERREYLRNAYADFVDKEKTLRL